ncbi:MAG: sugar ABC transporter substrate-binding protein [Candidatus Cloacimonetes bacterium]|nr:sugar ABC transporter substrate-binding protein [Candidatus Cloacimonadota bacterium]
MIKHTSLLISILLIYLFLSACNKQTDLGKKGPNTNQIDHLPTKLKSISSPLEIGILFWSETILGQVAMKNGLERELKNINVVRASLEYPLIQARTFVAGDGPQGTKNQYLQMQKLLKDPPDLIILQPTDTVSLTNLVKQANKLKVPVISYDQYIQDAEQLSFITSNNYQAGFLNGEYIDSHFEDHYEIKLILVEYPQVSSTVSRVNGLIQALEFGKQKYKILKSYSAVDPKSGSIAAHQILKDFPQKNSIDVIFTINDGGGLPVVDAFVKAKRNEVFFATIDGDPKSVENIKAGYTKIDSAQFCSELGVEAMRTAYRYLSGEKVPLEISLPVFPITKETIHRYKGWEGKIPKAFVKPWKKTKNPHWTPKINQ